jgi:ribosomal protein S18 acetylase RimI-like enzyme
MPIINAFHEANYHLHQKTGWFHFDLRHFLPDEAMETIAYQAELAVEIHEIPGSKTWWEGCSQANGMWFDAMVYQISTNRPVARLRMRVAYPDTEHTVAMYGGTWIASLMELRVHPDFATDGTKKYLLDEAVRYLASHNQVVQIEAHVAEGSPLFVLLHEQSWQKRGSGSVFVKQVQAPTEPVA